MMKTDMTLTTASLITVLLVTLHLAGDIAGQMAPGNLTTLAVTVAVATIWLYGTLILSGRKSGYVIMILGSLLGLVMPALHMKGAGVGATLARLEGGFFFVWILLALGVSAAFTLVLAVRGVWSLGRSTAPGAGRYQ